MLSCCYKCGVVSCKASDVCKYDIISSAPQYIKTIIHLEDEKMPGKRPGANDNSRNYTYLVL